MATITLDPFTSDDEDDAGMVCILVNGEDVERLTPDEARALAAALIGEADEVSRRRIAAGVRDGNLSWSDVAEQSARGWCPASPGGTEPHKVTDDATCDECGADLSV